MRYMYNLLVHGYFSYFCSYCIFIVTSQLFLMIVHDRILYSIYLFFILRPELIRYYRILKFANDQALIYKLAQLYSVLVYLPRNVEFSYTRSPLRAKISHIRVCSLLAVLITVGYQYII